jgi:hypothetical protein
MKRFFSWLNEDPTGWLPTDPDKNLTEWLKHTIRVIIGLPLFVGLLFAIIVVLTLAWMGFCWVFAHLGPDLDASIWDPRGWGIILWCIILYLLLALVVFVFSKRRK